MEQVDDLCIFCRSNKIAIGNNLCGDCMLKDIAIIYAINGNKKSLGARFWSWYDRHILHTTMIAVAIAFGATIPHIIWLDYMAINGVTIFEEHLEIDAFMVAVEHIEAIPLAKIIFDAIRILKRRYSKR